MAVLVHNPVSYPELKGNALVVGPGVESFISVAASHTEGSKSIRDFSVHRRNCLFADERDVKGSEVKIFKTYSEENCMLECRARTLLKKCNCIPYYYPRLDLLFAVKGEGNNATRSNHPNTNICTWDGLQCLQNSSDMLYSVRSSGMEDGADCRCPSSCSRTTYSAALSYADLPSKRSSTERSGTSIVHVYYRDLKAFKYSTRRLFTWQEILASFGGLVGLCTGFSFLSLAELVYFFTLRCTLPICRHRVGRQRKTDNVSSISSSRIIGKTTKVSPVDQTNVIMVNVQD